ncbi:hypothetical protein WDZ92_49895, partial [Nostoc sp. NIES-2111]
HLADEGIFRNLDAVTRGLTNNYAPGAFRAREVLGIDIWNSAKFADTVLPGDIPSVFGYARFLVGEFASEIGVLRGLEYRARYDGLGAPIPSPDLMAASRLDPLGPVTPTDLERDMIAARNGAGSYYWKDRVAYYKAWGDDRQNTQPTFLVSGLDMESIMGTTKETELLSFEVSNTSRDVEKSQWIVVKLAVEGQKGGREFLLQRDIEVQIAPGETRKFTIDALDSTILPNILTLYGAKVKV